MGCPLLILINFDLETEKYKRRKNDQTGTQASTFGANIANNMTPDCSLISDHSVCYQDKSSQE